LKQDHKTVKELFRTAKQMADAKRQKQIFQEIRTSWWFDLIAFSMCGTAAGQMCFATWRSMWACSESQRTTIVFAILTAFFSLKKSGESSVARFSNDS
jgi:hypothetical protein